jgi:hypothetical protein
MAQEQSNTKAERAKGTWKERIARELVNYWITFVYLAVFLGAFAWYRRFVLAEYQITYLHFGTAIIEALILAKVILIGDALGLGRGDENKPLIYPTLRKAVVFSCFVGVFAIVEHMVDGLIHGKGFAGGLAELWSEGKYEIFSRCLITFFAFIPFFAFRELGMLLGEGKLRALFFRGNPAVAFGKQG